MSNKQPPVALKCVHCAYRASGAREETVKDAMVEHYTTVHGPAAAETPNE
jgi:predicted small metal-binding protein